MTWYPIFLDLRGRKVLVAGAGKVALRKTKSLLEAGAVVTVIAPETDTAFAALDVRYLARKARPADVKGKSLVFAATNHRETNQRLAQAATKLGIPANIADAPEECTFLVPARYRAQDVHIAVSTGGKDPRIAVKVRDKIRQALQKEEEPHA